MLLSTRSRGGDDARAEAGDAEDGFRDLAGTEDGEGTNGARRVAKQN